MNDLNDRTDEIMAQLVTGIQHLREAERRPEPLPPPRPQLRLVHSAERRHDAEQDGLGVCDPEAVERMRWYARNIRSLREDQDAIDKAPWNRPLLTLVRAVDDPAKHRDNAGDKQGDIQ